MTFCADVGEGEAWKIVSDSSDVGRALDGGALSRLGPETTPVPYGKWGTNHLPIKRLLSTD